MASTTNLGSEQPKLFGPSFTLEDLTATFHDYVVDIEDAKLKAADVTSGFTIHDLIALYSKYISHIETVIRHSRFAAKIAESSILDSSESEHGRLIREALGDPSHEKQDEERKITEEEETKLVDEYAKYQELLDNMVESLDLFEGVLVGVALDAAWTTERRPWYPELKKQCEYLSKPIFSYNRPAYSKHMRSMSSLLKDLRPDSADAWEDGALQSNESFEATFEKFQSLGSINLKYDCQRKNLLQSSASLLREGCSNLQLDPKPVDIAWESLVDPEKCPTYIRMPFMSDPRFDLGHGVTVEGPLPGTQEMKRVPGMLDVKRALGYVPAKDTQGNTGAAKANTSKRRTAGIEDEEPSAKRHNTGVPKGIQDQARDAFNIAYADADVELLQSYAGMREAGGVEDIEVLTPLLPNRPVTMKSYKNNFLSIVHRARPFYKKVYDASSSTTSSSDLLKEMEAQIAQARGEVASHRGRENSASLKKQRLAAFKLVYLRALTMRHAAALAFHDDQPSSSSSSSSVDMDEQYANRLLDWAEHERAWNEADSYAVTHLRTGNPDAYLASIRKREASIAHWTRQVVTLRDRVAAKRRERDLLPSIVGAEPTQTTAAEKAAAAAAIKQVAEEREEALAVEAARKSALTDEDKSLLEARYAGTIFTNRRFRHRVSGRMDLDAEDSIGPDGADPFAAGGPPGYKRLPTETAWDKLQYMIVLTHWRFYQAFEFRL